MANTQVIFVKHNIFKHRLLGQCMNKIILASTLHDPKGSLEEAIKKYSPQLIKQHSNAVIAITPQTPDNIVNTIQAQGITCFKSGQSRRSTYVSSLNAGINLPGDLIFFCDFDRILHWIKTHSQEYTNTLKHTEFDFILVGRTHHAFETHPKTQKVTEGALNYYCSMLLGKMLMDFGAATFLMNKTIADKILKTTKYDYGIFAEWPVIAAMHTNRFGYFEAQGLEWETPDRFEAEIKSKGYSCWLKKFQTKQEWALRNTLMQEGIEAAYHQVNSAKNI